MLVVLLCRWLRVREQKLLRLQLWLRLWVLLLRVCGMDILIVLVLLLVPILVSICIWGIGSLRHGWQTRMWLSLWLR